MRIALPFQDIAARAYAATGQPDRVQEVAHAVERMAGQVPWGRAQAAYMRALVDDAGGRLLDAADALEAVGEVSNACLARIQHGERTPGDAATHALRQAYRRAEKLGLALYQERARAALRARGVAAPRRRAIQRSGPLTPRQLEVAQIAAKGLTNAEIGRVLFISPHTVGTHIKEIYRTLGVSSRAELTAWTFEQGHQG